MSFLNYENDASRLFVIREAAGEISRRSTGSSEPTVSTFFRPPYDVLTNLRAHSALHSSRIHLEEHANDFIITKRVSDRPFGSCTRIDSLARARSRSIYPAVPANLLIYDTIGKINPQDVTFSSSKLTSVLRATTLIFPVITHGGKAASKVLILIFRI